MFNDASFIDGCQDEADKTLKLLMAEFGLLIEGVLHQKSAFSNQKSAISRPRFQYRTINARAEIAEISRGR